MTNVLPVQVSMLLETVLLTLLVSTLPLTMAMVSLNQSESCVKLTLANQKAVFNLI